MNKIYGLLLALLCLSFPALLRAETLDQFNKSGGFEITGWSLAEAGWTFKGTERWISSEEPRSGEKALKLWDNSESHVLDLVMSKEFTGVPAGVYELSFWYRGDNTALSAQAGKESLAIGPTPSWKEFKIKVNAAGGTIPVSFTFKGAKNTKPWAWLDDLSLKKGE